MRIGLFTDSYPPYINGVSTSVETLKYALEKLGHTVYIVTVGTDSKTYSYDEKERILKVPGIPIGIYDYRAASIYPVKVLNKIKSWHLEVIHSHTELCMGIFARLFAKQHGIPLVHTYHTMYKDYTYYVSRNHKYFDLGCKKAVEYLSKFYCDNTATAFIVPTIKTYKLFREEYHYEKDIFIVPTGIDAKRFYKENVNMDQVKKLKKSLGFKNSDFVVIFVGRMAREKNIEFLLDVMKKLKEKNSNIKLLLVGDGPDKEEYEKKKDSLGLQESVVFAGRAPWNKMPLYYHTANVTVTASTTETQGLTVIEAFASSLPAVVINDEAFQGTVIDSLNGRVFNNIDECVNILEELSKDKQQLEILSKQSKITAKKYSTEEFANNVIEVYLAAKNKYELKYTNSFTGILKGIFKRKKEHIDE